MRVASLLLVLLSFACSGDDGTGDDTNRPPKDGEDTDSPERTVTITLAKPQAGAEFEAEEAVPLQVTAKKGSRATDIDSATWTIGGWTGEGASTEATGLPSGAHTVTVEAVVDGETYSASVDITVKEPAVTNWNYGGTLEAEVTLSTDDFGDFDDRCTAPITFTLNEGRIAGGGQCMIFDDLGVEDPLVFTMEGTVRSGEISGALVMTTDGEEARTPFEGTGTAGSPLTASFDSTHRSSDGSVRIVGSWSASPQ